MTTATYELMVIVDAELTEKEVEKVIAALEKQIKEQDGEIKIKDEIGIRDFSYTIKKKRQGFYLVLVLEFDPLKIAELETYLRLDRHCMRYLILKAPAGYEYQKLTEPEPRRRYQPQPEPEKTPVKPRRVSAKKDEKDLKIPIETSTEEKAIVRTEEETEMTRREEQVQEEESEMSEKAAEIEKQPEDETIAEEEAPKEKKEKAEKKTERSQLSDRQTLDKISSDLDKFLENPDSIT